MRNWSWIKQLASTVRLSSICNCWWRHQNIQSVGEFQLMGHHDTASSRFFTEAEIFSTHTDALLPLFLLSNRNFWQTKTCINFVCNLSKNCLIWYDKGVKDVKWDLSFLFPTLYFYWILVISFWWVSFHEFLNTTVFSPWEPVSWNF